MKIIKSIFSGYIILSIVALIIGGVFAVFIRTQMTDKSPDFEYQNMWNLHTAIMVFLFIVPAIPSFIKSIFKSKKINNDNTEIKNL